MRASSACHTKLRAVAFKPWTPYQVEMPPSGSYDPSLDAQEWAAQRGLFDLGQDTNTANIRGTVDYGLAQDQINRSNTRGLQDLQSQQQQVDTGYARTGEDYQRQLGLLQRSYQQLGNRQSQQQRAMGVAGGGAALQAAAKRAQNQTLDRQPLDTAYQRAGQDHQTALDQIGVARTRLGEDTQLQQGMLALQSAPPDANNPFGGRDWQDRTTALTRAQREGSAFGIDLNAQRFYQAAGAGWQPQSGPSNEFRDAQGNPYRVVVQGNQTVGIGPSGRVLWRRARR